MHTLKAPVAGAATKDSPRVAVSTLTANTETASTRRVEAAVAVVASAAADRVAPGVSAGRAAGRTSTCPPPTTPSPGSRGRLPGEWFTDVTVTVDREEIIVVGTLADETTDGAAAEGRISRFRAESRDARIAVAEEAQGRYGRKVSWGAQLGETSTLFTHISVPVMTRLRQPERRVLDTLVDAGVARSRSEALSWAVKLVAEHSEGWLGDLRTAMSEVDKLRATGPEL